MPQLSEERPAPSASGADGVYFARGTFPPGWNFVPSGGATIRNIDRLRQEDTRLISFSGTGEQSVHLTASQPLDISRETNAQLSLVVDYRVQDGPTAPVRIGMEGALVPVTNALKNAPKGEWQTLAILLGCFGTAGADMQKIRAPFVLSTSGRLTIAISGLSIVSVSVPQDRCSL